MKPVRFNATYDAGVSKIGCFFTIVDHFVAGIKKDGSDGHPLNILKVFTTPHRCSCLVGIVVAPGANVDERKF